MAVAAIRKWRSQALPPAPLLGVRWLIVPMKDTIGIGTIGVRLHHHRGTVAIIRRRLALVCMDMTESGVSVKSAAIVAESIGTKKN